MNTSNSILPKKVLLIAQAPAQFYRIPLLEGTQHLFIGPDTDDHFDQHGASWQRLKLHNSWKDGCQLNAILNKTGFKPDLIAIKADASKRTHIYNLDALPGKKILLMGDTHHMENPLRVMLDYARSEAWSLVSSEHDRHHLPLFREAGLNNLIWLPCYTMNPYRHPPSEVVDNRVVFVGSLSPHHIYRQHVINELQKWHVKLYIASAHQAEAAKLYNSSFISLNISLNSDLNFRVMEVLAAGGCLLTDRLGPDSGLDLLFTEDIHYIGYSSVEEALKKIKWLKDHPGIRNKIAYAGFERFWGTISPDIQSRALVSCLQGMSAPEIFKAPH